MTRPTAGGPDSAGTTDPADPLKGTDTGPGGGLATGRSMRARVGDRIMVQGPGVGKVRRDGEVVGVRHDDGSPPFDVRWSDNGRVTLYFPGPDAHIHHYEHPRPRHDG
ncbi:DUF1918 domain-containing protein [Streptomyces fradiae]|uniref:DUF1918 domain-containing protein n=1 Tax=Streptomyces fradiae TaxID=1906 RepID=UPI0029430191|nr:DUF1918 domain-containing protein [Streptomyces fradiae]WOI61313.1 DUF1918 domain-containing protein [Streptomyces fradiae]